MQSVTTASQARPRQSRRLSWAWVGAAVRNPKLRYAVGLYVASRLLFLAIGVFDMLVQHTSLTVQMSNWDGHWYLKTAAEWYWHGTMVNGHPLRAGQFTTLGFMPLYPALSWVIAHVIQVGYFAAGIIISMVTGAIATVQIAKLAEQWWGERAARRALAFWCFFPGTIVFGMIYTEGLQLALITSALVLLNRRRFLRAGVLVGFATAIAPVSLSGIVVCAVAAGREARARGIALTRSAPVRIWRDLNTRRAALAVPISAFGVVGFAIFLWFWTGSPLADYTAQHLAWEESPTPLAIPRVFGSLIHQIFISGVGTHGPGGIDINGVLALLGTFFLFYGLWLLWRSRREIPLIVWVWTICVAILALTSAKTPPNPRMLILAFPVVLVVGAKLEGRAFRWALALDLLATLVMSYFTFVGIWLRP